MQGRFVVLRRGRLRSDRGITLPLTALVLVPLLAAAALAVDVGGWYARAAQIQRAADAAALAGVTYLPQGVARAQAEAERVAERNGFDPDTDGITVSVAQVTGTSNRLRVSITVDEAPQTFSGLFRDDVPITRSAVAEYVQPVPLGSPRNYLGTGNLLPSSIRELFWLGVTGPCGSKEQGERITTISDANFTTNRNPPSGSNGFGGCTPGFGGYVVANNEFDPDGYFYAVEVPQGFTGNLGIQIYDGAYCTGDGPGSDGSPADRGGAAFTTTFTVRDKDNLDPRATTPLSTRQVGGDSMGSGVCSTSQIGSLAPWWSSRHFGGVCASPNNWGRCWRTIHTFTNPAPGIYYVQIDPQNSGVSQHGTNNFGLRLTRDGTFTACSADPTSGAPPFSATCPRVYGVTHMGVDASISGGFGTEFTFYLAEIGRHHRGKTLQIDLWDTGEGAQAIQIIEPDMTVADVDWVILCPDGSLPSSGSCASGTAPTGGWGPHSGTTIDVSGGNHPQPGAHRLSDSRFNDRLIRIQVPIDDYGASTWWRIRYRVGSSPTDRTTWSAIVLGDPVRLVG